MLSWFQLSATAAHPSARSTAPVPATAPLLPPVTIGNIKLDVPVILAPMAAVTNPPFRKLCSMHGARLTVAEMLHASLYLSDQVKPHFNASETRSVQLYGVDAGVLSAATRRLVDEHAVEHIDLNFGCPAPKILRRGGGAAVTGDARRFEAIVSGVVRAAGSIPVTCKLRAGYAGRETFREAGSIVEACGAAAVTLHARMAEELYDRGVGRARWWRIGELVEMLGIPVFGNGDVFQGMDAVDMVRETGCSGVVIGRGCLGRPWLFRDIENALCGTVRLTIPEVGVVLQAMQDLVAEIVALMIAQGVPEHRAVMSVRKWYGWFLQGYHGSEQLVEALLHAESMRDIRMTIAGFSDTVEIDVNDVIKERGKLGRE